MVMTSDNRPHQSVSHKLKIRSQQFEQSDSRTPPTALSTKRAVLLSKDSLDPPHQFVRAFLQLSKSLVSVSTTEPLAPRLTMLVLRSLISN